MGDFNFPNIEWKLFRSNSLDGVVFVQCVQEAFLTQYVDCPTRGEAILDLVLGNEPGQVIDLLVGEHFGDSDHNSVTFTLVMERDRCVQQGKVYNWGKCKYDVVRQELKCISWEHRLSGKDTSETWNLFKEQVLRVLDMYVPVRQGRDGRVREPWLTREVECLVKRKKETYVRLRKQGSDRALEGYKIARRELKKGIRRAKRGHEQSLAGRIKENPKAFYTYVRNMRMTRARVGPIKDSSGRLCIESEEIGEVLNKYFSSVFTNERGHIVGEDSVKQTGKLEEILVRTEDVLGILKSLRIDKSPGPDAIYPRILWEARDEIAESLAMIFSSSLSTGVVPGDWRVANVMSLFKKGIRDNPGNYRPVSLTSVVGKVMERVLRDRISEHLERHCLIRDSQHGFVRGRSCLTSLIEFFEEVTKHVDEGKAVDVVYMDFSKAFDKVPHGRLMQKVRRHGIVVNLASWITNWLTDRSQRVVADGKYSPWIPVTSGVPQGSVLGPLLFVIFINDLDEGVEGWVSKFADDTKIGGVVDNEEGCCRLQKDIDRMQSWAEKWQMEFNPEKCEVVHFGRTNMNVEYRVNGRVLGNVAEQRDLGVYVHTSLKVATQMDRAVKKAYGVLAFINRGVEFKSREVMI
ncbi:multiple inositol polyphosphate phosphatase 1b isoform X1 [Scyliorhinus torazame]|uniref:multiple inositol polyphosphate phosphatase 1b isoform X1 n=1 Tax=Scyliorhinus torazame TaxID=75743 RepID=UPI003B5970CB